MRKIGIRKLTTEAFKPYGSFGNILNPEGNPLSAKRDDIITFYPDMVQSKLGCSSNASFSACIIKAGNPWIVKNTEYHDYCSETLLITGGDYIMHVATARGGSEMPYDDIEAFLVPEGTVIMCNPGVWHQAGFPYKCEQVNILCVLPERAYNNDCVFIEIPKDKQIEVIDEFID